MRVGDPGSLFAIAQVEVATHGLCLHHPIREWTMDKEDLGHKAYFRNAVMRVLHAGALSGTKP